MARWSPAAERFLALVLLAVLALVVLFVVRAELLRTPAPGAAVEVAASRETPDPRGVTPAAAPLPNVTPGLRLDAARAGAGVVTGRVIDVDTGNPLPGIPVRWSTLPVTIPLNVGLRLVLLERVRDVRERYETELFGEVPGRRPDVTDADGRFTLPDVDTWPAHLQALAPHWYQTARVTLRAGDRRDDVQVPMRAGGRVVGRVTDRAGAPLAGVEVSLFDPQSLLSILTLESRGTRKVMARTDAGGRYELPAVAPGSGYFLYAVAPERPCVVRKGIDVGRLADTRVDVLVPSGGIVTGRVTGPGGEPVAGAEVRGVRLGSLYDMMFENDLGFYDATTGADGRYRVAALPAGSYRFFVAAEGAAPGASDSVLVVEDRVTRRVDVRLEAGSFLAGRVVDPEGRPLPGVFVRAGGGRLLLPGTPAARVSRAGVGVHVDQVELPVASYDEMSAEQQRRLRTELFRSLGILRDGDERGTRADDEVAERPFDGEDYTFLAHRFTATTGPDGTFRIDRLPRDEALWIWTHHEGWADRWIRGAVPGTGDLEIQLLPLAGFAGIVIAGDTAEPLRRFHVLARNLHGYDEFDEVITTEDGTFELAGLNAGGYRYSIVAEGYERFFEGRVEVRAGEVVRGEIVVLRPGAVIEGRVVTAAASEPVAGALVVPRREDGAFFENVIPRLVAGVRTGPDGTFRLVGAPAGDGILTATHPRFVPTEVAVPRLAPGETRSGVLVRMEAGGAIAGAALGPTGAGVAGVDVLVQSRDRSVLRQAVSGADGGFHVEGLPAGPYAVMRLDLDLSDGLYAMIPRLMNGLRPVAATVEDGRTTRVTLQIGTPREGTRVHGRVLEAGAPVAGAFVTFLRVDGGTPGVGGLTAGRTDAVGRYEVEGLEPGAYMVRLSGPPLQEGDVRLPVQVAAADEWPLDLHVPGGMLTGRVVAREGGFPLAGIAATLESAGASAALPALRQARVETAADGRFTFRRLPPGRYSVAVRGGRARGITFAGTRIAVPPLATDARADVGDVPLGRGGAVTGTVRDADGLPVERAAVFFRAAGGALDAAVADTLSGPDGAFRRDGLAPGTWRVSAKALGHGTAGADVLVVEGSAGRVELTLPAGASLRIAVVDAAGSPVAGAAVTVRDAGGHPVADLVGPADLVSGFLIGDGAPGVVFVTGLAPGPHVVRVRQDGYQEAAVEVAVTGDPTPLCVVLEEAATAR